MSASGRRRRLFGPKTAAGVAVAILAIVLPFAMDAFQLTTAVFVVIAPVGVRFPRSRSAHSTSPRASNYGSAGW
jgi:hypothetical protein